ncbi:MAG: hypothetical protein ACPG4N_06065 [Gammaproteobacteria bacterium]
MIYALLPERRIIRVYHGSLESAHSKEREEGDGRIREMADLIIGTTELRKPRRFRRLPWLNAVDFVLAPKHYHRAAVAARIAFRAESDWLRDAAV